MTAPNPGCAGERIRIMATKKAPAKKAPAKKTTAKKTTKKK